MDTTPAPQTMTPAEIHADAVQYLAAVRRAIMRMRERLAMPLNGGERRLAEQCLDALTHREAAAMLDVHGAATALRAAQPACCQGTPVPHRCGHASHRNHCTADTCW